MMTGLYGSSREKDLETGRALAELEPDTMRIYPTVVLSGTQLEEEMLAGRYHPPGVEETVPLCADLLELFEQRGIQVIRLGLQPRSSWKARRWEAASTRHWGSFVRMSDTSAGCWRKRRRWEKNGCCCGFPGERRPRCWDRSGAISAGWNRRAAGLR